MSDQSKERDEFSTEQISLALEGVQKQIKHCQTNHAYPCIEKGCFRYKVLIFKLDSEVAAREAAEQALEVELAKCWRGQLMDAQAKIEKMSAVVEASRWLVTGSYFGKEIEDLAAAIVTYDRALASLEKGSL